MYDNKKKNICEKIIIDTELFDEVEYTCDLDVDNFKLLPNKVRHNILYLSERENHDDIMYYPEKVKFGKRSESYKRKITIITEKLGQIDLNIYREINKPNHRNTIDIIFHDNSKISRTNCSGCLMSIDQLEKVPSLVFIKKSLDPFPEEVINVITIDEFARKIKNP